jgi:hypothetical protein
MSDMGVGRVFYRGHSLDIVRISVELCLYQYSPAGEAGSQGLKPGTVKSKKYEVKNR